MGAPQNYRIRNDFSGGAKTRFWKNVSAIQTLKELQESSASFATPEQQEILAQYAGWGGIFQVFDERLDNWSNEREKLKALISEAEYKSINRSILNSHYTPVNLVNCIYDALDRLGFKGKANILEPSVGSGMFLGLMPDHIAESSKITGIELDGVTSGIASYLYPGAIVINEGFQHVRISDSYFDIALGNPPFGKQSLYDPDRAELSNFSVHNYFLAKSIDSLRIGGIAAFVVSHWFLDAENSPARKYIAEKANLVGAIRLPNTALKTALTTVTTDIVFFQKSENPEIDPNWLYVSETQDINQELISVNKYFVDNPDQVLGQFCFNTTRDRDNVECLPLLGSNLDQELRQAIQILPENIYLERDIQQDIDNKLSEAFLEKLYAVKTGSLFITPDSKVAKRLSDTYVEPFAGGAWVFFAKSPSKNEVINDLNSDLIGFYRCLQNHPEELARQLGKLIPSRELWNDFNSQMQARGLTDIQRAARFYYVHRLAFGGKAFKRHFAPTPISPPKFQAAKNIEQLMGVVERLAGVQIENLPYLELMARYDRPGSFFYIDPPYFGSETYYGQDFFSPQDHAALAAMAATLKGKFLLSINDTPKARQVYNGFNIEEVNTRYSLDKGSRTMAKELFVSNY